LERSPHNQKQSNIYKNVLASLKKHGQINPLICTQEGEKYKICVGNNRFLAGVELEFKEFDIVVVPDEDRKRFKEIVKNYKPTDVIQ
jgi:ParB-like chromosome segregation protein Spo0J